MESGLEAWDVFFWRAAETILGMFLFGAMFFLARARQIGAGPRTVNRESNSRALKYIWALSLQALRLKALRLKALSFKASGS